MVQYDRVGHEVAYLKVEPGMTVTHIEVRCDPQRDRATGAEVTYTLTSLTEDGSKVVEDFTDEHYQRWIASWSEAINHYLETGQTLSGHQH